MLDSLEWFQEQRHWDDWLRKHEVEYSPLQKAIFHKYGAEGPSCVDKLDVPVLYVRADIQDTVVMMRETSVEVHVRPLVWKYDIEDVVADDLNSAFSSNLNRAETELVIPRTRSNTTIDRDLISVLFHDIILSCSCLTCPGIQTNLPKQMADTISTAVIWKYWGNIEDNDEERDNTPEEIHEVIYVKTINGKTISTRHHKNMTAAVILEEVERRTLVPRNMIRLVHKGKMISGKKSMKENNIEAKETIEMSLRLLGGMEVNEQMDTHETEGEKKKAG